MVVNLWHVARISTLSLNTCNVFIDEQCKVVADVLSTTQERLWLFAMALQRTATTRGVPVGALKHADMVEAWQTTEPEE